MKCSSCGKEVLQNAQFCDQCGTKIERLAKPGIAVGDVGMFKGNIDASTKTTIGQQTNITGDVNINVTGTDSGRNASTLMERGVRLLRAHAYDDAIKMLNESVRLEPLIPEARYYLALAMLKGRRPKLLTLAQARVIEENLQTACELERTQAHYYYLWALVKYDFYAVNGLLVRSPTVEQLLVAGASLTANRSAVDEMLSLIDINQGPVVAFILERR